MKYKLTFALVAALTSSAFAEFKAPLPEFKNEKQLAEWRAEKASEYISQSNAAAVTAFYTGKPYLSTAGNYSFKYRSYNPEMARWISEDPSGFPDGANGNIYAPNPNSEFDYQGLTKVSFTGAWSNSSVSTVNVTSPGEFEYVLTGNKKSFTTATGAWTGPLSGQVSCDGSVAGTIVSSIALSNFTNSGILNDGDGKYFTITAHYTYTYAQAGNINVEVVAKTSDKIRLFE
jgi:RHS repeat-associated protein